MTPPEVPTFFTFIVVTTDPSQCPVSLTLTPSRYTYYSVPLGFLKLRDLRLTSEGVPYFCTF